MTNFESIYEGQTIVFIKKPIGSYVSEQEEYLVEHKSNFYATFRNVKSGGATFDNKHMINTAKISILN